MQRSDDEGRPEASRWTVRDAIDFDALLQRDADVGPAVVVEAGSDRRAAFRAWLERQRAHASTTLPGEHYARGRRVVAWLAVVIGLLTGAGLVGGLLARGDAEPVNALLFFGATVGVQLLVLFIAAVAWLLDRSGLHLQPLRDLLLAAVRTFGRLVDRLDGERRSALQARWAGVDLRSASLAPLIGCDLLIVTQRFAIAFNIGLLVALLLVYLPFVELRFGWQTTYSIGSAGIDAWVRVVSLPWSWISPALTPDASQIAATQFTRGQSATTLPATAAHAWWPFLVSAIVVYGLIVRASLAVAVMLVLRHRLARLTWHQPAAHALWRRLTGPLMVADANTSALPDGAPNVSGSGDRGPCLLIVDHELDAASVIDPVTRSFKANIDDDRLEADLVDALRANRERIVVATSTHRDPVTAVADFLRAVAAAARPEVECTVQLIGHVSDERLTIWSRFVTIQRIAFGVERAR